MKFFLNFFVRLRFLICIFPNLFKGIFNKGKKLAELHINYLDNKVSSQLKGDGKSIIEKRKYEDQKLWINRTQYFTGITKDIWGYEIGGYLVLDHWLKDRVKKHLTIEEIETFGRIVATIKKTFEIIRKINKLTKNI